MWGAWETGLDRLAAWLDPWSVPAAVPILAVPALAAALVAFRRSRHRGDRDAPTAARLRRATTVPAPAAQTLPPPAPPLPPEEPPSAARTGCLVTLAVPESPCRWRRNGLRPGTRLARYVCGHCGVEAYAMAHSPPRECKRALRGSGL